MNAIIIPKTRVKEFTRMISKYNMVQPVELKDGTFFIDGDYLKAESMVDPDSYVGIELTKDIISEVLLSTDKFVKKILTPVDYKIEAEPVTIKR